MCDYAVAKAINVTAVVREYIERAKDRKIKMGEQGRGAREMVKHLQATIKHVCGERM